MAYTARSRGDRGGHRDRRWRCRSQCAAHGLRTGQRHRASQRGHLVVAVADRDSWRGPGASRRGREACDSGVGGPARAALRVDVAETITCAYMAGATLVGVTLSTVAGLWWAQYVAAFALLFFRRAGGVGG